MSDLLTHGDSLTSARLGMWGSNNNMEEVSGLNKSFYKRSRKTRSCVSPLLVQNFGWGTVEAFWKDDACQPEKTH